IYFHVGLFALPSELFLIFPFNDKSKSMFYTLYLHDALPISEELVLRAMEELAYTPNRIAQGLSNQRSNAIAFVLPTITNPFFPEDRKSTRLNSSHVSISYAVFCLNKKR